MDERYYILGGLGLLLLILVIYFVVALVRYRSAVKRARSQTSALDLEAKDRYLAVSAEHAEDVFAVPVAGGFVAGSRTSRGWPSRRSRRCSSGCIRCSHLFT